MALIPVEEAGGHRKPWFRRFIVSQRFTQITPPAATPDELCQSVKAAWSAAPQEHIQSFFESMPRSVAAVISNNDGNAGY
ncbi:hypothetical protein TNCV_506321 [Trichonephila clavipes]|nr:hypothetical protein TNCV_506321 [Trichonephila clavipes]